MRTLERYDLAGWPDDFREIDSRIPGTRSDIEHAFADCDPGPLPAI
jgi:hypothetical protein